MVRAALPLTQLSASLCFPRKDSLFSLGPSQEHLRLFLLFLPEWYDPPSSLYKGVFISMEITHLVAGLYSCLWRTIVLCWLMWEETSYLWGNYPLGRRSWSVENEERELSTTIRPIHPSFVQCFLTMDATWPFASSFWGLYFLSRKPGTVY